MDKLIEILERLKPGVDFKNEKALVDDAILDSLNIITIISELSDEFDVTVSPDMITPENFNSAEKMFSLVEQLSND